MGIINPLVGGLGLGASGLSDKITSDVINQIIDQTNSNSTDLDQNILKEGQFITPIRGTLLQYGLDGSKTLDSDLSLTYDISQQTLQVGMNQSSTTNVPFLRVSTDSNRYAALFECTTSSLQQRIGFFENSTTENCQIIRNNSTRSGNINGTSISNISTFQFLSGSSGAADKPVVLRGTPVYGITGITGTNKGFRLDVTGIRVGNISTLHIANTATFEVTNSTGYAQLRLTTPYSPTSTSDANGATGDVSWDNNNVYVKTSAGWKKSALSTF